MTSLNCGAVSVSWHGDDRIYRNWTRGVGKGLFGKWSVEQTCSKIRDLIHVVYLNLLLRRVRWRVRSKALAPFTSLVL